MIKKHTPWVSTIRVFKVTQEEVVMLKNMYGCRNINRMTAGSLNFAALAGNEIIHKLIRGSRNAK